MPFDADVKKYLRDYQKEYNAAMQGQQHTAELSFRVPMHNLFTALSKDLNPEGQFDIILEPKKQGKVGRPDWRIQDKVSLGIYGYIEGKGPSADPFDITPYQNQINRYLTLGHKLIITDGIDFVFSFNDTPVVVSIINKANLDVDDWSKLPVNSRFRFYMEKFFANPSPQYLDEEQLVELVAVRTRMLADDIFKQSELTEDEALNDEERQVINLLNGLKELVYNHNDPTLRTGEVFADFTAQVIMFCLLYAHRVICSNADSPSEKSIKIREFAFSDVTDDETLLPFHNLMVYLRNNSGAETFIMQWVDECISFLSFVQMTDQQLSCPDYHRLFELFLEKFDKKAKFDYGAFYTPKVLADFIVRLTNKIIYEEFNGATIYDDGNTIIDPCCGTGSFLEQVILHDDGDGAYNLDGFEILPAPYMLANYRMAIVQKQYQKHNTKINIVLANTLSNCVLGGEADEDSIEGSELIRAKELSSRPLKLIIGNLPCSDSERNNNSEDFSTINELMEDFRPPVESRHGRQNIQKQTNNPFMQFIRWSCEKLTCYENDSALAFVVPLSFLETESYKYARKYLTEHFNNIWAISIDSDARTGVRGDSIFKTLQGRAVIILTKECNNNRWISRINYADISKKSLEEKINIMGEDIDTIKNLFVSFPLSETMYSFMPSQPFDENLYNSFWPMSNDAGKAIFINQCSGSKMTPTALLTHVKKPMLKRRSREIAKDGITKAQEWIGHEDKKVVRSKIIAFQDALNTCHDYKELDAVLSENIWACSFRPFVNSYALLWDKVYEYQAGVGGGGARIRPEIKAVYKLDDTIGFSLAHAPKDLDESLGRFASFCWYFPDNDLCKRGNAHIYLNQYIPNTKTNEVINNVNEEIINHYIKETGLTPKECARKVVFYSYAIFCSQVYLDEFYGALFVVNQSEKRARIPMVEDGDAFLKIAALGEKLANLEKNGAAVDNVLEYDYDSIIDQLPTNFQLEHSKSINGNPYDEDHEEFILKGENTDVVIRVYCPLFIQRFTVSGYNVIKDCWLKFHSYRYTHCEFTKKDFKDLLDLFNKIALQSKYIDKIDEVVHQIIDGETKLLVYVE